MTNELPHVSLSSSIYLLYYKIHIIHGEKAVTPSRRGVRLWVMNDSTSWSSERQIGMVYTYPYSYQRILHKNLELLKRPLL